jgi:hypothetical protein
MQQNVASSLDFERHRALPTSHPSARHLGAILNPKVEVHALKLPGNLRAHRTLASLRWNNLSWTPCGLIGFRFKSPMMATKRCRGRVIGVGLGSFVALNIKVSVSGFEAAHG